MHMQCLLAVVTTLITVSLSRHHGAGKRQLDGYQIASTSSTAPSAEATTHTHWWDPKMGTPEEPKWWKHRTKSSKGGYSLTGTYGTNPSGYYPTGTCTGTSQHGSATGTGGVGPLSTGDITPYANITSSSPPTPPNSFSALSNPSSALPISALPTSLLSTRVSSCAPPLTTTQSTTVTVTVTTTVFTAPVSAAASSSAPFPALGNSTLGYPTGTTGTGTGSITLGTGTVFQTPAAFSTVTDYIVSVPKSPLPEPVYGQFVSATAAASTTALQAYT